MIFDILKGKTLKVNISVFKDNKSQLVYLGILDSNPKIPKTPEIEL